jgi:hypothetical protein
MAAPNIHIEIPELPAVIRKFAVDFYASSVRSALRDWGYEATKVAKEEVPVWTSLTQKTINTRFDTFSPIPTWVRVEPTTKYAAAIERGRRPGIRPPIAEIRHWAEAHGINPYALAWSIAKRGTKANPFMARTAARVGIGRLNFYLARAVKEVEFKWRMQR